MKSDKHILGDGDFISEFYPDPRSPLNDVMHLKPAKWIFILLKKEWQPCWIFKRKMSGVKEKLRILCARAVYYTFGWCESLV
jgi:hypothetical protein